ncbi:MAG: ABC transporter ATP-binding protein [Ignavibacteriae bacterium]|nr:ABC transporter ATP-binding protein [Ignavibacteriota bacterium]
MPDILIKVEELKKSYQITKSNNLEVLKGVNLDIYKSEVVAIVGRSGAGKSTLLHILGTLDKPDSGSMTFENLDVFSMQDKQLASFRANDIGFIFQFHHLLPEFTALENVMIPAMIAGRKDEGKAKLLLEEVGLAGRISHKPSELSGGEAQRVAIARALINQPRIVLADEPTGNLDTQNADAVIELIFSLRNKYGHTFVIVTHNEDFAAKCDRIVKMSDGVIV